MKIEIKHRFNNSVLFTVEAKSLRIALQIAVKSNADLRNAYLSNADLSNAYLLYADLRNADLSNAYLRNAYLRNAYLRNADLSNADLRNADLSNAYLSNAYLSNADLSNAKGVNKYLCTPLEILREQTGKIRAYKLVGSDWNGVFYSGIKYIIGKTVEVKEADDNEKVQCSYGISLATLDWCMKEWRCDRKILVCEFTRNDIVAIPIASDGKFRVRKCKVIKEVDLEKTGLIKKEDKAKKCEP